MCFRGPNVIQEQPFETGMAWHGQTHGIWGMVIPPSCGISVDFSPWDTMGILTPTNGRMTVPFYDHTHNSLNIYMYNMQAVELDGRSRSSQRPSMASVKWKPITKSGTARYPIFLPLAPGLTAHEQLGHLQV